MGKGAVEYGVAFSLVVKMSVIPDFCVKLTPRPYNTAMRVHITGPLSLL